MNLDFLFSNLKFKIDLGRLKCLEQNFGVHKFLTRFNYFKLSYFYRKCFILNCTAFPKRLLFFNKKYLLNVCRRNQFKFKSRY
jgi:hypothetical protein